MWHFHVDWMKSALMGGAILMAEPRLRVYVGGCRYHMLLFLRWFTDCCRDARSVESSYGYMWYYGLPSRMG